MRCILLLIYLLLVNQFIHGQWEFVNEHVGNYEQIQFINESTGLITGYNTLLKTADGGNEWQTADLSDEIEFYQFHLINESTILAVGLPSSSENYFLYRSDDGGESWQKGGSFPGQRWNQNRYIISDSLFYSSAFEEINDTTEERRIFKTINGAASWENITPQYQDLGFQNLQIVREWFINDKTGIVIVENTKDLSWDEISLIDVVNIIFRTTDGGVTWQEQVTDLNDITNLQFIDDSTGYFIASENGVYSFYETTDTFNTWTIQYAPESNESIVSFGFKSADEVYSVVGYTSEYSWFFDSLNLKRSLNAGYSWERIHSLGINPFWEGGISPLRFAGSKCLFTVEFGGGGYWGPICSAVFTSETMDNDWQISLLSYPFSAVSFFDENLGYAGGGADIFHGPDFGDLFKTKDGGKSWELCLSWGFPFGKFQFVNGKTGYILENGWEPGMLKTIDEGKSWNYIKSFNDTTVYRISANDMQFLNEKSGWIAGWYERYETAGNGAAIFTTNDGGENWDRVWHKVSSPQVEDDRLNSVHIANNKLWAVGDRGLVVNSDDLENFRIVDVGTTLPLNDVFYIDWGQIWITGGFGAPGNDEFQSVLLRSINNGATWETYQFSEYALHDLYFETIHHGWAVGTDTSEKGIILETFNGGQNWTVQVDELPYSMKTLSAKKGYLWAIGENGLLLRYKLLNWIESTPSLSSPDNFMLQQNYPNPFRSTTTISYQISEATSITLCIYNQLGKQIATLDTGEKMRGNYYIDWNATGIKPGIYYYKLETSKGLSETRKLILLD